MVAGSQLPPEERRTGGLFGRPIEVVAALWTGPIEDRLAGVAGLDDRTRTVVARSARRRLLADLEAKLNRVLLLELHGASLGGQLAGADEERRWAAFLELATAPEFADRLHARYPTLRARVGASARNLANATATLAARLVADRAALDALAGRPLGELTGLALGSGDPHRGGHTVSRLEFTGGSVMYKPRPMEVDAALDSVLAALVPGRGRIRTPAILVREGYGWTAFVHHRHCASEDETADFYQNLGRWLAVMRLIGGTDLHAGNIIAAGPVPVVVDAETMFAPTAVDAVTARPDGTAAALASRVLQRAVLRTGILPMRVGLFAGVDLSAAGRLVDEQPVISVPGITGAGTDGARLVEREARLPAALNHPTAEPEPERYWEQIVSGFQELSAQLRRRDREGTLAPTLKPFIGTEIRQVLRSTQVYGDVRHMLWHPAALHDEPAALEHARAALRRHSAANPVAPGDDAALAVEIADLLVGDTPVYHTDLTEDQVASALDDWRAADLDLEARLIRFALPGAFSDGHVSAGRSAAPLRRSAAKAAGIPADPAEIDQRRRELAAAGIAELRDTAIRGSDGSATWIGPVLAGAGWAVRELNADLYSGQAGVVLCLAGYQREAAAGRVPEVAGLPELLTGALAALRTAEQTQPTPHVGALTGIAGRIWTWRTLAGLLDDQTLLRRAVAHASVLLKALDQQTDWAAGWLDGLAGAVTPLLDLARTTGDPTWSVTATGIGRRLAATAEFDGTGFARGGAGVGWALHRLLFDPRVELAAQECGRWRRLAERAFRTGTGSGATSGEWCRGTAGTGLAACDLYARTGDQRFLALVDKAVRVGPAPQGRSLCHGACGSWELLEAADRVGAPLPPGAEREERAARLLRRLAAPPQPGLDTVEATAPGLLTGLSGAVLTLLRMHPEHAVPSPLLLTAGR
ncbi:type 2 lanthipeptide synthetase LanM family protein [Kitasatospora sp. NPDC006697]|uniref:type 2 lanthipeptide synthetase LanM family protein n=1 Tax=Kitasatospora sp. NPDC006697 TaxID=3364020 RepID=UPI0036CA290F